MDRSPRNSNSGSSNSGAASASAGDSSNSGAGGATGLTTSQDVNSVDNNNNKLSSISSSSTKHAVSALPLSPGVRSKLKEIRGFPSLHHSSRQLTGGVGDDGGSGGGFGSGSANGGPVMRQVATFNLRNFCLADSLMAHGKWKKPKDNSSGGLGSSKKQKKKAAAFQIAIDHNKRLVAINATDHTSTFCRHFVSLASVLCDEKDPSHFFISFGDQHAVAQCQANSEAEGKCIIAELQQIVAAEPRVRRFLQGDVLYAAKVSKRGKLSWGERWMVVRPARIDVFKSKPFLVPSNSFDMKDVTILVEGSSSNGSASGSGSASAPTSTSKQFTMILPERKYAWKCATATERECMVDLIKRAAMTVPTAAAAAPTKSKAIASPVQQQQQDTVSELGFLKSSVKTKRPARYQRRVSTFLSLHDKLQRNTSVVKAMPRSVIAEGFGSDGSSHNQSIKMKRLEFAEIAVEEKLIQVDKRVTSGVYQLMDRVVDSMSTGASLGQSLFVPKRAWYQIGVKFQAFSPKFEAFEMLSSGIDEFVAELEVKSMLTPPPPSSSSSSSSNSSNSSKCCSGVELEKMLIRFRLLCEEIQNKLSQHLSFIHSCKAVDSIKEKYQKNPGKGKSKLGKFKHAFKGIIKATKRAASSGKSKIDDSAHYVNLIKSVLVKAKTPFPAVVRFVSRHASELSKRAASDWTPELVEDMQEHLVMVSEFFYRIVLNIVIREMKVVLKRYMKHNFASFITALSAKND
jgi:hypothetical protein